MENRESLHLVFKNEDEKCEKRLKQLHEEALGQSVNRKTKGEMKTLKEKHGKCCKWMIMCQGIASWLKEYVEKSEPSPEQEEKKEVKGDVVSMLKSLHYLQQENKKLEGQIQTLTTKKEKLELARAQLSVPFTSDPASSEVMGDTAGL